MNGRLRFSLIGETKAVKYKVSCGTRVSHVARRDEMQSDIRLWGERGYPLSGRLKGEEEASRGRIREGEEMCECGALLGPRVAVSCCRTCQLRSRSCGGFPRR